MFRYIKYPFAFFVGIFSTLFGASLVFGHGSALTLWGYDQTVHGAGIGMGLIGCATWAAAIVLWRKFEWVSAGLAFFAGLGLMMAGNYFYLTYGETDTGMQILNLVIFGILPMGIGIMMAALGLWTPGKGIFAID